ncbi:MAG: DNA-directed RNA polymerase subunit omega [Rickettsiales bacterium]|nr:DNA-directed RNA polymerase subunit omega [Rickettsiales bacterium]
MARVTIEDCLEKVDDRFELVALAAQRAKEISAGAELTIERKGEKDTVISLREIAEGNVTIDSLRVGVVNSLQKERIRSEAFVAPANSNELAISIEDEEADIKAAIEESGDSYVSEDEENLEDAGFHDSETGEENPSDDDR